MALQAVTTSAQFCASNDLLTNGNYSAFVVIQRSVMVFILTTWFLASTHYAAQKFPVAAEERIMPNKLVFGTLKVVKCSALCKY